MAKISVMICCANSEASLPAACESVKWADELVIVDSGSEDATAEIARRYADRYVVEPWRGYTEQKHFGCSLVNNDWVLILDGDEEVSPQLADELSKMTDEELDRYDMLLVPRQNWLLDRPARAWWPDYGSRLFHRERVTWADEALHDARLSKDPRRVGRCKGWLLHKRVSGAGFEDYFSGRRLDARLLNVARQMHQRGRRCRCWDLWLRPWLTFWKLYLIKGGFLDGAFGILIAQKTALTTQLRYAALWYVQEIEAKRSDGK